MPAESKVELTQALEDSPRTQATVGYMGEFIVPIQKFVRQLKETSQKLYARQMKASESISEFGKILNAADERVFGVKDPYMVVAMKQLGRQMSMLQSWQEMLCAQLDQALIQQLETFLKKDVATVLHLREFHTAARAEHDQAVLKFSKFSKKKETEKSRYDANAGLFAARRKFYTSSLNYYSELNSFQYKKKFSVLDPLLVFMQAQLSYFKMGHEILTSEVGEFLTSLDAEIKKERSEHEQAMKTQRQTKRQLESQSSQLCIPDPNPSDPFVQYQPADLQLTSKSGYLYHRPPNIKSWERLYFYTKGQLLYSQQQYKAPTVFFDLVAENVTASTTDVDDRRYVFKIIAIQYGQSQRQRRQQQQRRPLLHIFQAESAKSRDEWIATIVNIVSKKPTPQLPQPSQPPTADLIEFETTRERSSSDQARERIQFVNQEHMRFAALSQMSSLPTKLTEQQLTAESKEPASYVHHPPPALLQLPRAQQQTKQPQQPAMIPRIPPPPHPSESIKVKQLLQIADSEGVRRTGSGYEENYSVRFLGSLEVIQSRGIGLIKEAIRTVIAARALKEVATSTVNNVNMIITHRSITIVNLESGKACIQFKLKDMSYCGRHPDNENLFGIIVKQWADGKETFLCYVFEGDNISGKSICQSIIDAIKVAVEVVTDTQTDLPEGLSSDSIFDQVPPIHEVTNLMDLATANTFSTPPQSISNTGGLNGRVDTELPDDHSTIHVPNRISKATTEHREDPLIDFLLKPASSVSQEPIVATSSALTEDRSSLSSDIPSYHSQPLDHENENVPHKTSPSFISVDHPLMNDEEYVSPIMPEKKHLATERRLSVSSSDSCSDTDPLIKPKTGKAAAVNKSKNDSFETPLSIDELAGLQQATDLALSSSGELPTSKPEVTDKEGFP